MNGRQSHQPICNGPLVLGAGSLPFGDLIAASSTCVIEPTLANVALDAPHAMHNHFGLPATPSTPQQGQTLPGFDSGFPQAPSLSQLDPIETPGFDADDWSSIVSSDSFAATSSSPHNQPHGPCEPPTHPVDVIFQAKHKTGSGMPFVFPVDVIFQADRLGQHMAVASYSGSPRGPMDWGDLWDSSSDLSSRRSSTIFTVSLDPLSSNVMFTPHDISAQLGMPPVDQSYSTSTGSFRSSPSIESLSLRCTIPHQEPDYVFCPPRADAQGSSPQSSPTKRAHNRRPRAAPYQRSDGSSEAIDVLTHCQKTKVDGQTRFTCAIPDCTQCPREKHKPMFYGRKDRMEAHVFGHLGIKPFACSEAECEMAFTRTSDLARHLKEVHEKAKEHVCTDCGKAFGRAEGLRIHKSKHYKL